MWFETIFLLALFALVLTLSLSWTVRFGMMSGLRLNFLRKVSGFNKKSTADNEDCLVNEVSQDKEEYPVKYLSEGNNHSLLRLIPWDASGVLSSDSTGFHFRGRKPDGNDLELEINPDDAVINHQKGSLLWDGGRTWCVIEVDGEKHYFTSDTSSEKSQEVDNLSSTDIYRSLTNRYLRED